MAYWLTGFAGLTVPTNLGDRGSMDVAAGVADAPLIALPGGRVFDPLGSNPAYRPSAAFVARVMIVSNTPGTIKTVFDSWQAAIGTVGTLTRTADSGGTTHTITARLLSATVLGRLVEGSRIVRMVLTFQAISLPWTGDPYVGSGSSFGPLTAAISGHVYTVTIANGGNVTQRAVSWGIRANAGTVTALTISNTTTGHAFTYTGSLAAGNWVFIDNATRTVLNNGVGDYSHFTPPTLYEDWFALAPGNNTVTYQATFGGGVTATLQVVTKDAWG